MPRKILTIGDALSNPIRRRIVLLLAENPGMSVRQLARAVGIGLGNLTGHILILERVGLVKEKKDGKRVMLFVNEEHFVNSHVRKRFLNGMNY